MTFGMKILTEKENMIVIYEMLAQLPPGGNRPFSPDTLLGACIDTGAFKESIRGKMCICTAWINFIFWQLSF